MQLPLIPVPVRGETVDGFLLKALVSDGRYTRLFAAVDEIEGGEVVLKFPKPQVAAVATYRAAFAREAWVGARVHSPWVGRTMEQPPGRRTCLYIVMPLYQGELLETRLKRRPLLDLEEGRNIAIKLARGVAALHRVGVIHRDIKPDNVILEEDGSLKLIDLGVVRVPGLEDFLPEDIPGTSGYMAPEMFDGEPGNEATDLYAVGVTIFRAFTGEFPYGNPDATSPPRLRRPTPLSALRPDLPAWLQEAFGRAIAIDPVERFRDVIEFAAEMEAGPARALGLRSAGRERSMNAPHSKSGRPWQRSSPFSSSCRCCGIKVSCLISIQDQRGEEHMKLDWILSSDQQRTEPAEETALWRKALSRAALSEVCSTIW